MRRAEEVDDDNRRQAEQQLDYARRPFAGARRCVEARRVEQRRARRPVAWVLEGLARRSCLLCRATWRARSRRGHRRPASATAPPPGRPAARSRAAGSPRARSASCGRGARAARVPSSRLAAASRSRRRHLISPARAGALLQQFAVASRPSPARAASSGHESPGFAAARRREAIRTAVKATAIGGEDDRLPAPPDQPDGRPDRGREQTRAICIAPRPGSASRRGPVRPDPPDLGGEEAAESSGSALISSQTVRRPIRAEPCRFPAPGSSRAASRARSLKPQSARTGLGREQRRIARIVGEDDRRDPLGVASAGR